MEPFIRWFGGKTSKLDKFTGFLPSNVRDRVYFELFLGSGAMLFHLKPREAFISDLNERLINCYLVIRDELPALIKELDGFRDAEKKTWNAGFGKDEKLRELYDGIKSEFNDSPVQGARSAAMMIYLNVRCYNGLYRVNSSGEFNTPFGGDDKKRRLIYDARNLASMSAYFKNNAVTIFAGDYRQAPICDVPYRKRFYFLDPPYVPLTKTASFTQYGSSPWEEKDFDNFRVFLDGLNAGGAKFLACNSDTPKTRALFAGYHVFSHAIQRSASCKGNDRGTVKEIVVTNYPVTSIDDFIA